MAPLAALLCSRNEHKRRELEQALPGWRLELLEAEYPEESGAGYEANARAKARFGRTLEAGSWLVGEDSGLEVEALAGAPGIETARWAAGRHVERVLEALRGVEGRHARYVCALVALAPDGRELCAAGVLEGEIALGPRGVEGFGFDPVFVPEGETATVSELGDAWKARHSHRARAARALLAALDAAL